MLSVICAIIASVICFVIEYIFMPDIFNIWHCICTLIISIPFLDLVLYDIEKISFLKEIEPLIEIKILSRKEIVALMDSSTITGHHFLGCGCIDENMYYYYLEKTEVGCKMARILATDVSIIEDDKEIPRIEEQEVWKVQNYRLIKKPTIWYSFSLFFKCKKYKVGETIQDIMTKQDNKTIIYVPTNSITTDYKIDLK